MTPEEALIEINVVADQLDFIAPEHPLASLREAIPRLREAAVVLGKELKNGRH